MPPLQQALAHLGLRLGADGLRITHPSLSLDGDSRRGIAFVAEVDGRRRTAARVLCSMATARARGWVGAMTPPWGKPFQLGRLALAVLPAGSGPGAACLRMHIDGVTILDARLGRMDPLPGCEAPELREADAVLVDARWAAVESATVAALRSFLLAEAGRGGVVQWHDATLAWSARALLAGEGVAVRPSPMLLRAWRRLPSGGRVRKGLPSLAFVLDTEGHGAVTAAVYDPRQPSPPRSGLAIARQACGTQLDQMVAAVGAREVLALDAAGAAVLAKRLAGTGVQVTLLHRAEQLGLVGLGSWAPQGQEGEG